MEYSTDSYFIFTFGCVGYVKLFRAQFSFETEHPTRAVFIFCAACDLNTGVWFLCARCNSQVAFGCTWALLLLFVASWCLCYSYRTPKSGFSYRGS